MVIKPEVKMQIGKNGLTPDFIQSLKNTFKKRKKVKVKALKSAVGSKKEIEKIAKEIKKELGEENFNFGVIGHTIKIRKD